MMADNSLPQDDRLAVRTFFRKSRRLFKRRSYVGLIEDCLSPELKQDVRYLISKQLFERVWYFKECDREFLEDLSTSIHRVAYSPKEEISADEHLNVLTVGMATRGAAMLQAGAAFGDIILTSAALRDTTPARCMIYCEAARISRVALHEALKSHPEARDIIRQAAIKLALNRAMVIISLHVQLRKERNAQPAPTSPAKQQVSSPQRLPAPSPDPGAGTDAASTGSEERPRPDNELKDTLHSMLGTEWKEVEYQDGQPVGFTQESASGLGPKADALLEEIGDADPKLQPLMLAKLVLSTNARLDKLTDSLTRAVTGMGSDQHTAAVTAGRAAHATLLRGLSSNAAAGLASEYDSDLKA